MSRRYDAYATGARAGYKRGKRAVYRSKQYKRLKAGYAPGRRRHRGWGIQYHQPTNDTANSFGRSWQEATDVQKQNRRAQNYYGRGRYYSGRGRFSLRRFGRQARNTARMLGRQARRAGHTLDAMAPAAALIPGVGTGLAAGMEGLSSGLGEVASVGRHIRGSGAYAAPMINDSDEIVLGQRFAPPQFATDADDADDGGLQMSNQEFVANIYGNPDGEAFTYQMFTVNPGLAKTFPMLSQFAVNFERYEMIQCVFHFETALDSGVLQSETGQVGDVLMYSHIDPTEPEFESVSDFLSNGGSATQITKGMTCGVECDPSQLAGLPNNGLNFVRSGPQIDDKQQESDQATFQIAIADTPSKLANHVIGKLYVSYTVRLVKPRLVSLQGGNILHDSFSAISRRTLSDGDPQWIIPAVNDQPSRLPHSNIGGEIRVSPSTSNTQTLKYILPPHLNGVFKLRLRVMSDDPPGSSSQDHPADTWQNFSTSLADTIHQLVQDVTTEGNVKVLPHGLRLEASPTTGGYGHTQLVYYDPADHVEDTGTVLDGCVDNFIVFTTTGNFRKLAWVGYFECTIKCSPSTLAQDNEVNINLASDSSAWPTPVDVAGDGADISNYDVRCNMQFDVSSTNGFDIASSTKLVTHINDLVTRNTELAAYAANTTV